MTCRPSIIQSLRTGLLVSVVFCIAMAFLDVLLASILDPFNASTFVTVTTALAIAVVMYWALYLASWLLVGLPLTIGWKLDATCVAVSCASLIASLVSATMIVSGVRCRARGRTGFRPARLV